MDRGYELIREHVTQPPRPEHSSLESFEKHQQVGHFDLAM
jgi:hypothetical protein